MDHLFLVRLCCQNYCGLCFTCESWDTKLEERVEALPCEEAWSYCFWFLCVAPLRLGGIRGKKSTPSIGWEVPVKSWIHPPIQPIDTLSPLCLDCILVGFQGCLRIK
jgi:hypothetical protein